MTDQKISYEEIVPAGRNESRKIAQGYGRSIMFISYDKIAMKPKGNYRKPAIYQTHDEWLEELNLEELADAIYANNGPGDPIEGDVEKNTGIFFITEGQRRWKALGILIKEGLETYPNGSPVNKVEVLCNPSDFTTADRLKRNWVSQNKMKLKPSQIAAGFKDYKEITKNDDGSTKTNKQIAEEHGVSRQFVDNMLRINELSPDILKKLDYGDISQNDALETLRKPKDKNTEEVNNQIITTIDENRGIVIKEGNINTEDNSIDFFGMMSGNNIDEEDGEDDTDGDTLSSTKVETKAALDAEEQSRKTATKLPEQKNTERQEAEDAMITIDFRPDKIQGEFLINEIRKNQDKMEVLIGHFPENLKQYKNDIIQLISWNSKKLDDVLEILKKASDKR
jgi:hypothetical protein